jgi:hypothetical protein
MVRAGGVPAVCGVAGCMLMFLQPLLSVFTRTELVLLLAGAYGYDQWQGLAERAVGDDARARKRPLTVVEVTREGKMTLLRGDVKAGGDGWRKSESDAESVGTASTADASDASLLSLSSRSGEGSDAQFDDRDDGERGIVGSSSSSESSAVVHADGRALFVTSSICMSRSSVDQLRDMVFDHARGHLELRQDAMYVRFRSHDTHSLHLSDSTTCRFHLIRRWGTCSVHLSVRSGHLHVHLKTSKNRYSRLQLADFTGAAVHRRRKTDFQATFYGHAPLHFRARSAADAELWVRALEYAKEFTWHLWAA